MRKIAVYTAVVIALTASAFGAGWSWNDSHAKSAPTAGLSDGGLQ